MSAASRLAIGLLLAAAPAAAQHNLVDPTRPPVVAPVRAQQAAEPAGPALQSVLLAPGRKIAVINGQPVALGGKVGEATLVRLTETEAELRQGGDSKVLKLFPAVNKQPVGGEGEAKGENQR